jgi:predicted transcriptional regulator
VADERVATPPGYHRYITGNTWEEIVAESTFTFRVDDALKAAFAEVAANQERTAAQLLRVLMKDAVHRDRELREHDRWFRGEIDLALSEADDPATTRLAHESVRSSWQQQRATLERRAPGRPA